MNIKRYVRSYSVSSPCIKLIVERILSIRIKANFNSNQKEDAGTAPTWTHSFRLSSNTPETPGERQKILAMAHPVTMDLVWNFHVVTKGSSVNGFKVARHTAEEKITLRAAPGRQISKKSFVVTYSSQTGGENYCVIESEELDEDEDVVAVVLKAHARSGGGVNERGSTQGVAKIGTREK